MKTKTVVMIIVLSILVVTTIWFATNGGANSNASKKELIPISSISHGHGLAVDPNDESKLYVATHYGLLLLKDEKDLYQVGSKRDDYMGFSPHPTDSNVFFASGHSSSGGNIGFQRSDDGGFTWKKISNGLGGPVDFHALTVSPVDPYIAYGWYRRDMQKTTDGGTSWTSNPTEFPIIHLAADAKDTQTIYASSPQGLFKSSDSGITWKQLFKGFVSTSAVHPENGNILSVSEKYGLAESADGGETWKSIPEKFEGETPLFISFYRENPDIAYLLTEKNSVYKSIDGGQMWKKLPVLGSGSHEE